MVNSPSTSTSAVPPPVGVIDLGSNTLLLLVLGAGGVSVLEEAHVTRLSEGLFPSGKLQDEAARRSLAVVSGLVDRARSVGADPVVAVGTEALRRATNAGEFMRRLADETGLQRARVLTGEEEARFAIEASRRSIARPGYSVAVIDVGGGSTEVAWTIDETGVQGLSLPLGSVRLTEGHVQSHPVPPDELEAVRALIRESLSPPAVRDALTSIGRAEVVAVAGTATTLAALDQRLPSYDPVAVEGYVMTRARLEGWLADLAGRSVGERLALPGMDPGRADVIVAGLATLAGVLEALGVEEFRVSGRGVRYGVALHLLEHPEAVW
jgi:exopolyphosphatase/guanosine-5'-triphosphate,3'-diphosphate pyrophosphatase